ncbi:hypothetical protein B0J11DRAFT_599215 [Dendryphion nanum]|uniref:Uncharacterized protein n=1 Tax=Dendryphion nanum TaxID=256645 RepID=A0A9P9D1X3_9PLEO|nr:hypothetical protein B0J11DRAFT_599215 [Dendryphion nanum]
MAMPSDATALGLAIDTKLFDIAVRHMDFTGKAIELSELPTLSGSDPNLVLRIVCFLLGHGLFTEVAAQCYQATELGRSLVNSQPMGAVVLAMSTSLPSFGNMIQYFRKNGFNNPYDAKGGPWQDSQGSDESFFEWLEGRQARSILANVREAMSEDSVLVKILGGVRVVVLSS